MRILPPSDQEEQFNIYEMEDWVPYYLESVTRFGITVTIPESQRLPSTSYRIRWNERTASWTCDWFDENGDPIDQGRRLSANWWLRTPWGNGTLPDPMPAWIAFLEVGDTGEEAGYEDLGRRLRLVELSAQDVLDAGLVDPPLSGYSVTAP